MTKTLSIWGRTPLPGHHAFNGAGMVFLMCAIFILGTVSNAHGFEMVTTPRAADDTAGANSSLNFHYNPSPALADPCLPLLDRADHAASLSAMDRNQRSAGRSAAPTAALGFVLGLRLALGPKEVLKNRPRVQVGPELVQSDNGRSYALSIASYRQCKNQLVLNRLNATQGWGR